MTTVLAWERLYDGVSADFAAAGIRCEHVFGWRSVSQHARQRARIAWVPGDPSDGLGAMSAARNPGGFPRSLATLGELFTVYISHQDSSAPEDERRQYHLVRLLRDAWFRVVYRLAHGTIAVRGETWVNTPQLERRYGATLRIVCELQAPVWDFVPAELVTQPEPPEPPLTSTEVVDAVAEAAAVGAEIEADIDVTLTNEGGP